MFRFDKQPYKSASGHWITKQLFVEQHSLLAEDKRLYEPIFSLNGEPGYIDARATFIALGDPTGYLWAMAYLGSFTHFEAFSKSEWFEPHLNNWKAELEAKLKAEAIQIIHQIAKGDSPQALMASKYLAGADYKKTASGRGRPSKEEVTGELKRAAEQISSTGQDAERIGLTLVAGGKK